MFANVYSTAISAQNVTPRVDRRVLAVIVGAVSTVLALVFDIVAGFNVARGRRHQGGGLGSGAPYNRNGL